MQLQKSSLAIRLLSAALLAAMLPALPAWSAEPAEKAPQADPAVQNLVQCALESEAAGKNDLRAECLQQALEESPQDAPTHWQLGQVWVNGRWMTQEQAQKAAGGDKRLAEYRKLRDKGTSTVESQAALARWCRKNKLFDEERGQWQAVLQLQPDNAEAIKGLGLKPFAGMLLTQPQIQQIKTEIRRFNKAIDRWRPLVAQWLKAVEHHETAPPAEVRDKLAKISDSADMLAFDRVLWQEVGTKRHKEAYRAMLLATLEMLSGNSHPAAAECMTRVAVFSDLKDVHAAAIEGLKKRPLDQYAPLLLSGLHMPIEAKFSVPVDTPANFGLRCTLYQEGALADVSSSWDLNMSSWFLFDSGTLTPADDSEMNVPARVEFAALGGFQLVRNVTSAVERANEGIQRRNARITAALSQLTGYDLGDEPMKWWKWWWQDYTEMYNISGGSSGTTEPYQPMPAKPVYQSAHWQEYRAVTTYSCFAAGTAVWALGGWQKIEKIKVGDRVLAQDVETGELAYKPVLAVTVREPTPTMKIGVGSDELIATLGHPFWVASQGWRMTKQLKVGSRLHTLSGGVAVKSLEKLSFDQGYAGMAYNLIVADFNTYFVGDSAILVHDNTPRQATAAVLPGLVRR